MEFCLLFEYRSQSPDYEGQNMKEMLSLEEKKERNREAQRRHRARAHPERPTRIYRKRRAPAPPNAQASMPASYPVPDFSPLKSSTPSQDFLDSLPGPRDVYDINNMFTDEEQSLASGPLDANWTSPQNTSLSSPATVAPSEMLSTNCTRQTSWSARSDAGAIVPSPQTAEIISSPVTPLSTGRTISKVPSTLDLLQHMRQMQEIDLEHDEAQRDRDRLWAENNKDTRMI